ncbi:TetR/AcrR family transcriptional regulator [Phycicoccus sp. CSK15P-2]|uniref:TetR/AcrR family transcriptional regulator n=1 Tax=Phycicoccus sp. CSK15P-2 TaxID=2807627 RepID=UPI001950F772|nr:TetR/AcrR family transcriptional regulator [Phycicoccus sp. CSK15P-2]MBM6403053.1 TetR/AcrR family transcriptional regulator [Phycicoccus sp. CSK15P-2]
MSANRPTEAIDGGVRTRLMRAAELLLASSADGRISTREICSRAGVTAPTLYHHFKDKEALLDAVVLEGFNTYLAQKRAVAWSGDVLEDFRAGWDMHVSFGCEHPAHYRLMFGNPRADQVAPAASVARDEVAHTVAAWGADGHLKIPVDAATQTISAAAVGVALQLIALRADSTHPISTNVRDTVAQALFHPRDAGDDAAVGVSRPARLLLDALPPGSPAPLRPTEVALLREWLTSLSATTE